MADKRMFSKSIIDSDAFLSMPLSTQALYFHLSMRADDEGFIDKPKGIMRNIGASEDDMKILITKRYVLTFPSGILVIKHWRIHNYIRKDRIKKTNYQEELAMLDLKDNDSYTEKKDMSVKCQSSDSQLPDNCQHRLDKNSIDKISIDKISIDKNRLESEVEEIIRDENGNITNYKEWSKKKWKTY